MDLDVGPVHSCWMPLSHFRHEELQYQAGLTTTTFNCVTFILGTLLTLALNPNFPDLDPATPVERMRMRNALCYLHESSRRGSLPPLEDRYTSWLEICLIRCTGDLLHPNTFPVQWHNLWNLSDKVRDRLDAEKCMSEQVYSFDFDNAAVEFDSILWNPSQFDLHPYIFNILVAFKNVMADGDWNWSAMMTVHSHCRGLPAAVKDGYRTINYIVAARLPLRIMEARTHNQEVAACKLREQVSNTIDELSRVRHRANDLTNEVHNLKCALADGEILLGQRDGYINELEAHIAELEKCPPTMCGAPMSEQDDREPSRRTSSKRNIEQVKDNGSDASTG